MTAYWFRPKRYGYGATPVTWQGWAVTGIAVVLFLGAALLATAIGRTMPVAALALIGFEAVVIALLVVVTQRKTDGEWRWGGTDDRK